MIRFHRKTFFDGFRARLDRTISQEQVDGIEFLLAMLEKSDIVKTTQQMAYILATVFHETATSMQPVEEGYYLGSKASAFQKKLRYFPYFGRGYVQLTWKTNYAKATREIRKQIPSLVTEFEARTRSTFDLVASPKQALDPAIAFATLTLGIMQGWYGPKGLPHYINERKVDYIEARRTVNIKDKAGLIAGYAASFEKILIASRSVKVSGNAPIAAVTPTSIPDIDNFIANREAIATNPRDDSQVTHPKAAEIPPSLTGYSELPDTSNNADADDDAKIVKAIPTGIVKKLIQRAAAILGFSAIGQHGNDLIDWLSGNISTGELAKQILVSLAQILRGEIAWPLKLVIAFIAATLIVTMFRFITQWLEMKYQADPNVNDVVVVTPDTKPGIGTVIDALKAFAWAKIKR